MFKRHFLNANGISDKVFLSEETRPKNCGKLVMAVENVDPARRARLIELLDIDLRWRMHKVSDGQRRRVQICMGLLQPFQVCYCSHTLVGTVTTIYEH